MKIYLKMLTAVMAVGVISSMSQFTVNTIAYADTTAVQSEVDTRPHFDTNGYVVVDDLQFHKTSDTTVEVFKGVNFDESKITIPSSISVDDVRFAVTSIADNAFKNTVKDDTRTYAATNIVIPSSITKVGNYCFYDLINVQYIDLSKLPNTGSGYGNGKSMIPIDGSIAWNAFGMNSSAKLDRIKLPGYWFSVPYDSRYGDVKTDGFSIKYDPYDFKPISFKDVENNMLSYWFAKSSVRINELQDAPEQKNYTFSGWKENTYTTSGTYQNRGLGTANYSIQYVYYTPTYEKGQPLWDVEDKINKSLSTFAVDEDTTQTELLRLIESCLTFDNISYSVDDFRIIPSQDDVRGALRCTINLKNTNTNETGSIDVDIYTTELPTTEKINGLLSEYNNYTENTDSEELRQYLKVRLADNGLEVNISNFNNDKEHITGIIEVTNKLDNLKKNVSFCKIIPNNIKNIIESAIASLRLNSISTANSVAKQIVNYINDDGIFDISVIDFSNANGQVKGTVVAKDSNGISTLVDLKVQIPERSQSLADAYEIVNANLASLVVSDNNSYDDVLTYLSKGVNDGAIEISIPNFRNKNGAVKGTITLVDVDENETKTIELNMNTIESNVGTIIDNTRISSSTTSDDMYKNIIEALGNDTFDAAIEDFKNENGHITGVIVITKNDGTIIKIPLDKTAVHQTVEQAAYIINKNLTDYVPTSSVTGSQVIKDLSVGIKDADIEVTIPDFNNDGNAVTGTIKISKADSTSTEIALNKKAAQNNTNTVNNNNGTNSENASGTGNGNLGYGNASGSGYGSVNSSSESNPTVSTNPNITTNPVISANPTISGGSSSSSTGAINLGFNPVMGSNSATSGNVTNGDTNVSTPVNVTVNLNGNDILKAMQSQNTSNWYNSGSSLTNDDVFNLLLQYMRNTRR